MWIDYAIYLTTGVVLASRFVVIYVLARRSSSTALRLVLVVLAVVGSIATFLVRPERFREMGESLVIAEVDGRPRTEVELIGLCLSIFRKVGPLSFIVENDLFPGDNWDRGPVRACEASGHSGKIYLPESVRSGNWILCDYAGCHPLIRA